MNTQRAGFVGLGLMGAPMTANLVNKGWAVTAWNRSPGALEGIRHVGGSAADSVELLRDEPVIVFMLPDLAYIEDAATGLLASWQSAPPAAGTALVVMSSVSPTRVKAFGRRGPGGQCRQRRGGGRARQWRDQGRY